MVYLHIRSSDKKNEFLYECTTSTQIKDLLEDLIHLHNNRLCTLKMSAACKALAHYGPMRPEECRGISSDVAALTGVDMKMYEQPSCVDPTEQRVGVPPPPEAAKLLTQQAEECEHTLLHSQPHKPLNKQMIQHCWDSLKGSVMIAFPGYTQLPTWDTARQMIEADDPTTIGDDTPYHQVGKTHLWWAGKQLLPSKQLSEYIGCNEKSKLLVRLQSDTAGAPMREPRIDEATQKGMLAFYHKRQQDAKLLEADDDTGYLNAEWADPKAFKKTLITGGRRLQWHM